MFARLEILPKRLLSNERFIAQLSFQHFGKQAIQWFSRRRVYPELEWKFEKLDENAAF
jgi:hypothetical protein